MPATVTLASTTLLANVLHDDVFITVASTANITPGLALWIDRELMSVRSLGVGTQVNVKRAIGGSHAQPHNSSTTVLIGSPEQFYTRDPVGRPPQVTLVAPWINTVNGNVWYAQGDAIPGDTANRWWQLVTPTYGVGPLGVNTFTSSPTSST